MVCNNCGREFEDGSNFCYGCGSKIIYIDKQADEIADSVNIDQSNINEYSRNYLVRKIISGVSWVALFILAVYGICIIWTANVNSQMVKRINNSNYKSAISSYEHSPARLLSNIPLNCVKKSKALYSYALLVNAIETYSYSQINENIDEIQKLYSECDEATKIIDISNNLEMIKSLVYADEVTEDVDRLYDSAYELYESYMDCYLASEDMYIYLSEGDVINRSEYDYCLIKCEEYKNLINGEKTKYYDKYKDISMSFGEKYYADSEKSVFENIPQCIFYKYVEEINGYDEFLRMVELCTDGTLEETINSHEDENGINWSRMAWALNLSLAKPRVIDYSVWQEHSEKAIQDMMENEKVIMYKYTYYLFRQSMLEKLEII